MKITRKTSYKIIGLQVALFLALTLTQAVMMFAKDYRYVGFEKKDNSWVTIGETAEANLQSCQKDLSQAQADKQTAILSANPDLK